MTTRIVQRARNIAPHPRTLQGTTDTNHNLAALRSRWHILSDLDRALSVKLAHEEGFTLREIAAQLNCSPALLSLLLQAGQAPPEDRALAREGMLSTRSLVRRAKAAGIHRAARHREEIALERERKALQSTKPVFN